MKEKEAQPVEVETIEKYSKFTFSDFKKEEEILEHKDCSASIGPLYKDDFYACSFVGDSSYYLCTHCANVCHKGHGDRKVSKGNFKCSCAENGHNPPVNKNEFTGSEKCFYQQLFESTPNSGYYYITEGKQKKPYCAVCAFTCKAPKKVEEKGKGKKAKTEEVIPPVKVDEENKLDQRCCCTNHDIRNAVLLQGDLYSHKEFTSYLKNFNYNIFFKNETAKSTMINYLLEKIKLCQNKKKSKGDISQIIANFLNDSNIEAILTVFYIASLTWKNKFFYIEGNEFENHIPTILNILSYQTTSNQYPQCKVQLYLSNLLFSIIVRGEYISKNNLWNINTIANMNIKQRKKYLVNQSKKKTKPKVHEYQKELLKSILEIYDRLLRDYYSDSIGMENIRIEIFPLFNKLMKFAIKYKIGDEDDNSKYFELVEETIKFILENKEKNKTEDSILKKRISTSFSSLMEDTEHDFNLLSLDFDRNAIKISTEDEKKETEGTLVLETKVII